MELERLWIVRDPELIDGTRDWLWEEYTSDEDRRLAYCAEPEGYTIAGFVRYVFGTARLDPGLWSAEWTKLHSDAESAGADVDRRLARDTRDYESRHGQRSG